MPNPKRRLTLPTGPRYRATSLASCFVVTTASPYDVAAVNQADPAFADSHPNATHWKDSDDNWCYLACDRWSDERSVDVSRRDGVWNDNWWFAGVRK